MHCSPSWLQGCGRHCVSHNAPVEYEKTLQLLFPPERGLLRMTHCYIYKGQNRSRLFVRERVELLIELFGRCKKHKHGLSLMMSFGQECDAN